MNMQEINSVASEEVAGRVVKVRKVGSKLVFFDVSTNGSIVQCVFEESNGNLIPDVRKGDYLVAEGKTKDKPQSSQRRAGELSQEFAVNALVKISRPEGHSEILEYATDVTRIEALRARSIANAVIPSFLVSKGFIPVTSPSIVGDWAEGNTGPFPVKFYDHPNAYLTLSTMVHHQIMQTMGYHNIFEMPKLFRKNTLASGKKLSEFTNVVIGQTRGTIDDLTAQFSDMIAMLHREFLKTNFAKLKFPETVQFEKISHDELLKCVGLSDYKGHQFPQKVREYIDSNFKSFLWVTGFPQRTRPFFVKSVNGVCDDAQLWFQGKNFLAAGGVREIDPDVVLGKIIGEGKDPLRYEFYLSALKMGAPEMANMDIGLERFLANFFDDRKPADFTFFPRFEGRLVP